MWTTAGYLHRTTNGLKPASIFSKGTPRLGEEDEYQHSKPDDEPEFYLYVSYLSSVKPFPQGAYSAGVGKGVVGVGGAEVAPPPPWEGRAIATHKLRLVEFSAFMEQQRDPETVSIVICLSLKRYFLNFLLECHGIYFPGWN